MTKNYELNLRKQKENLVFESKGVRFILINLNKKKINYAKKISEETKITHTHVMAKFKTLREEGLIEFVKVKNQKRRKYYRLTEKGKSVVNLLIKIHNLV